MPFVLLIVLAAVLGTVVLLAVALAVLSRRPALMTRLARLAPVRHLMVRATRWQIRRARKRGRVAAGTTDLEVILAGQTGAEAEAARAMLKRMSPRQRAEFSRRTLGGDGLAALMDPGARGDDASAPGRADRRRAVRSSKGGSGRRPEDAPARGRAAKKGARRR